jgi:hypothetical protein
VAEIAAGAWAYCHEDRLDALIEEQVMKTVKQDYSEASGKSFDMLQQSVHTIFLFKYFKNLV